MKRPADEIHRERVRHAEANADFWDRQMCELDDFPSREARQAAHAQLAKTQASLRDIEDRVAALNGMGIDNLSSFNPDAAANEP